MPTYEYQCTGCGQTFEVFQRMSDQPLSSCPDCGAAARRKISGGAGFLLKGEGFYITDHRSQEYKDKAAADAGKQKPASAPKAGPGSGSDRSGPGRRKESAASTAEPGKTSSGADSAKSSSRSGSARPPTGTGSAKPASGGGSRR